MQCDVQRKGNKLTCLDTRLRALGVEEGKVETDEATLLETVAGDEDSLAAFLRGGVLVTGAGTFLILAAEEEEAAVCPDLMDDEDEEVVIDVILAAAEEEDPVVCLDFMDEDDEDPSISKLMSSREMVSLLRMMLDLALDWTLDLR